MYGLQTFPTPADQINLLKIKSLQERFQLSIGYQDHTNPEDIRAYWLPLCAVSLGADVLEKHITHDRSLKGFDHEAAFNPDEFKAFVEQVRSFEKTLGKPEIDVFSEGEKEYRSYAKKSIVANNHLPKESLLREEDISFLRTPEPGLKPEQWREVLGQRLNKPVSKGQVILKEDLQ